MPKMLEVTGGRLNYAEYGEGPEAIVFVHGGGSNHLSWWNQIRALNPPLERVMPAEYNAVLEELLAEGSG